MKKILSLTIILALLGVCLTGCQSESSSNNNTGDNSIITLSGTSISAGDGVSVNGNIATITTAGTYEITGTLDDGQILVDTSGEVTLILNNAQINCSTSAPIYVKEASQVVITLADGSENIIADGEIYDLANSVTEPDAAIYSKADMVINGGGSLSVTANYNDGITSKDTLLIDNGNISINSKNHGIKGKDYLMINDGTITVQAGGDGIKATNDTQVSLGYVEINGGTINITANDEGVSAISNVNIKDGSIAINTPNNGIKSDGLIDISGGNVEIETGDDGLMSAERNISDVATVMVNGEAVPAT